MSKYTDGERQQVRDWVEDGLNRLAVFMYETHGLPVEVFNYQLKEKCPTIGHQLALISNAAKKNPKVFEGMKHFVPESK